MGKQRRDKRKKKIKTKWPRRPKRAEPRKKLPIWLLGSKLSKRKYRRAERQKKVMTKQGRKQDKETLKKVGDRPGRQKKNLPLTKRHTTKRAESRKKLPMRLLGSRLSK